MEYYAKSDIGNFREKNEDYYYVSDNLFIVADGMGGHKSGEVASKTAVEKFVEYFFKNIKFLFTDLKDKDDKKIKSLLSDSIAAVNREIVKLAESDPVYEGMGTTFTGCYILLKEKIMEAHIIHVGDSRLYFKSSRVFEQVTDDQTLVGKMCRDGLITYEQSFSHPLKNYLENVIGLETDFKSDYLKLNLLPKDILVLCTDGLNSMIRDKEINSIITKYRHPQKITDTLIERAKVMGGHDNITVITIKF